MTPFIQAGTGEAAYPHSFTPPPSETYPKLFNLSPSGTQQSSPYFSASAKPFYPATAAGASAGAGAVEVAPQF